MVSTPTAFPVPAASPTAGAAPGPAAARPAPRPRRDPALADRLAASAAVTTGTHLATEHVYDWLAERRAANTFRVERIPFAAMDGWLFAPETGNLVHRSGKFFTVEGFHVTVEGLTVDGESARREWYQPILNQPEIAILGIVAAEIDGVLHFLMQAKMEPGNPNLLQLSPTVQATRSNYTKVHRGADVRYLEYFLGPARGRVIADSLQSEQGSWFDRKSNRNIIVEVDGPVPDYDDFCWLTLGQIGELLHSGNTINMDARSVLSTLPFGEAGRAGAALHSDAELLSWFTGVRAGYDVRAQRIPLAGVPEWTRGEGSLDHDAGRYFRVVAVAVQAGNREVASWTQPLLEPRGEAVACFLTHRFGGVPHVLAHAHPEGGFLDTVELGPTVQCTPDNYAHLPADQQPLFLDEVLAADPSRVRYETTHSEEGGRFLNAEGRYLVVEARDDFAVQPPPPDYRWVTAGQLTSLVRHGHYVNMQARTLLAALNAGGVNR